MAELIHMRQRIKTVETIKKITHAMRLVSMSAHAKLGKQFAAIKTYHASITAILNQVNALAALNNHKTESPGPQRTLLIAVGSQKGLSGSFNSVLFYELSAYLSRQNRFVQIISVGKKMVDLVSSTYKNRNIISFPNLSATQAPAIAQTITERIITNQNNFTSVMILSMVPKNFFIQMARTTPLLPLQLPPSPLQGYGVIATPERLREGGEHETTAPTSHDYLWESDPAQLMEQLTKQYITSTIYKALLESLVAEQAARFVSMDSATRNAEKILEATKLKYNKLRQAKITKELLELADTF
jgi:F-type H+-transporting ATPase subunit gamma